MRAVPRSSFMIRSRFTSCPELATADRRGLRSLGLLSLWACLLMFPAPALARAESTAQQGASPQAAPQAAELVTQGFDLLEQREPARAAEAFRRAIEMRAELAEAHRGLGLAL